MFLAVDSSLGTSVGLVSREGAVLAEAMSEDPRGHAENIGALLQRALAEGQVEPADISHVVMGVGPGPFTGLRVGIAAATAFSLAQGIPLVPIVSHDAVAYGRGDVVVVTDARRGEVAYSVYCGEQVERRTFGPALTRPENLDKALGAYSGFPRVEASVISAASLGLVAWEYLRAGVTLDSPAAQYLRAPDVTVSP
jgi:tRNA threonylcarbamoyl adenosine modification protein YeaZ